MELVPAQASAFPFAGEEGPWLVIPIMEASISYSLLLCTGGRLPSQALSSLSPLCPILVGEEFRRVGEAFGVPVSPLSDHQPVPGSPHISTRERIASGLKIGHCSESVRGREEEGWGWGMEEASICFIN